MLQAEQGSREASRGAADWLADEGKLLEDGFPLKFWLGWKEASVEKNTGQNIGVELPLDS